MKTIRSFMILAGLSVVLFALGATGAKGQVLEATHFAGTLTLPLDAQWGSVTLPAGEYNLAYGQLFKGGVYTVMITGKAEGTPHGMVLAGPRNDVSATKNALVCVRNGDALIVRALELPAIGESISFALPRGVDLMANQGKHGTNTEIAQAPMLIQRVQIKMNEQ